MSDDEQQPAGDVEGWARNQAGPYLTKALAGLDIEALSTHDLVVVIQAWERAKAHVEAAQTRALAELCDRPQYARCTCPIDVVHEHRPVEPAGDEVSLALAWTPGRARNRVTVAVELSTELPDTLLSLEEGRIDADKARLIADRTRCLATTEQRREVESRVLPIAQRKTRAQLDRALRREVIAVDPQAAEQRRRTGAERRRVSRPEPASPGGEDGMAMMNLYGPVEDLTALFTAIDAAARRAHDQGDQRTLEQLRFDTLTDLGWTGLDLAHLGCCSPSCTTSNIPDGSADTSGTPDGGTSSGDFPGSASGTGTADCGHDNGVTLLGHRHGRAAAVNVTVAASTLFGAGEQPAWLDGFGPITAEASRRISTEGPWRRLLTDPATMELLEYGRTTYVPPPHLAAFVAARDRTCRLPTCERPAHDADIDHKQPYGNGGTTGAGNTWALHKGHHFGRTHHGYTIHTDAHGNTWWTTPAGHQYRVKPEAVGLPARPGYGSAATSSETDRRRPV